MEIQFPTLRGCDCHPVHMRLSNRFGTDSNRFGRHVNATKKFQIDSKPIWPNLFESRFEINCHVNALRLESALTPVIIIRLTSSFFYFISTENNNFRTIDRFRIAP